MDISFLIDPLNDAQREAVTTESKHALILAGAGSGKTRVLVHRIAWLIGIGQARPYNILAVTFTNKAAKEMQTRIEKLINTPLQGMWVGTFHGIAHRLLRLHWKDANLPQTFQVLDSEEQKRAIKRVIRSLELDDKTWTPKQVQNFINNRKENIQRAKDIIIDQDDDWLAKMVTIYHAYELYCQQIGVVDFAELLFRVYELLNNNEELRLQYQQRFKYILVDEFQDTNVIQYLWLKLLVGEHNNTFVVGDDDQSIYTWRGAKIENILNFSDDFTDTHTIRLEQNYRSSGLF